MIGGFAKLGRAFDKDIKKAITLSHTLRGAVKLETGFHIQLSIFVYGLESRVRARLLLRGYRSSPPEVFFKKDAL